MRILFEVSPLNAGGPQSWVCDMASALKQRGLIVNVVSFELQPARDTICADRLLKEGIPAMRILLQGSWRNKLSTIKAAFRAFGPCDVVHFNSDVFSGLLVPFTRHIPVRIIHARTPNWRFRGRGLKNFLLHQLSIWQARRLCTHALGVTAESLQAITGRQRNGCIPGEIMPSAIRASRFFGHIGSRNHLPPGGNAGKLAIGFVGRLTPSKNPVLVIDVLSRLREKGIHAEVVIIGAGPEEQAIKTQVVRRGLGEYVTLYPPGNNIEEMLAQKMDVLILPSDFEGTPRVVMESQACGVPVVCSTAVSPDVCIVPDLFHRISLAKGSAAWAEMVLQASATHVSRAQVESCFSKSPCEIENQAGVLIDRYRQLLQAAQRPQ